MTSPSTQVKTMVADLQARGQFLEAGFATLRAMAIPANASEDQIKSMRMAFFHGASYVFDGLMLSVDAGVEPTEADLFRVAALQKEIQQFETAFAQQLQTRGTA